MTRVPLHHVWIPIASTLVVLALLWFVVIDDPRRLTRRSMTGDELISQVVALVEDRYIRELDDMQVAYDAIRGVVEGLDPYSQFYDPRQAVAFEEETEGRFGGIGVLVRREDGVLVVSYPMLDSPADRAGLRPCDRFVEIDGEPIPPILDARTHDAVVSRLKGVPGTPIRLTVESAEGELREVEVVRESIPRRSVVGVEVLDAEAGIGYMLVKSFQETTVDEFDAAMRRLLRPPKIRSLILDMRSNPGGILDEAIDLADRFLASGTIVTTRGRSERATKEYTATAENDLPEELALVVLVNGDSASASEVFAGAVQDHRRALLVGAPTYGKGVVQNVLYLNRDEVVLKVTSAAYFTPSGRCIEKRVEIPGVGTDEGGILPDLVVRDLERAPGELERYLYRARPGEDYAFDMVPCPYPRPAVPPDGGGAGDGEGRSAPPDSDGPDGNGAEPAGGPEAFRDPQLERALDLLRGEQVFQSLLRDPRDPDAQGRGPAPGGSPAPTESGEGGPTGGGR